MESGWNSERIIALIRLAAMLACGALGGFGLTTDPEALSTVLLVVAAAVVAVYSWWKNANVTKAAQDAQAYLDAIKKGGEQ
jgi:uncharacterized membrane protein YfcA